MWVNFDLRICFRLGTRKNRRIYLIEQFGLFDRRHMAALVSDLEF